MTWVNTVMDVEKLKDSKDFLQVILANIDTAVLIVDGNLEIHEFNDSFLRLFSSELPDLSDQGFGQASGCINAVSENKPCGRTSLCHACHFRQTLMTSIQKSIPIEKQPLEREFVINGRLEKKYLEFTCRPVSYEDGSMLLVFIYDVTQIETTKRTLKEKQDQISVDLERAGEIQRSLLPTEKMNIQGLKTNWFFLPSLKVGGDNFHVYDENHHRVSGYMLDVSGHGVSAALVSVMAKQFLDHLHLEGVKKGCPYSPEKILKLLDEQFPFERFYSYFTIACILLDLKTGNLKYANAGHMPPVLIRNEGGIDVLDQGGTIIGIEKDSHPVHYEARLSKKDILLLFTDGLVDYIGQKGEWYNINSFYESLSKLKNITADQVVKKIMAQRIHNDTQAPADDISLLALEYEGL